MREIFRAACLAVATLLLPVAGTAAAAGPPPAPPALSPTQGPGTVAALALPRPTGPLAVGRDTLHLVDQHRRDPWVPTVARELMVDIYYPARPATGTPARYATAEEIRAYLAALGLADALPVQALADTRIASRAGALPLPGRRPLVLLSPGLGVGRRSLTGLAEDLASRGLVAATVDHAYESVATVFPGGRTLTCVACDRMRTDADFAAASRGRAADLSFVLDSLTGAHPAWRDAAVIDPARVAAVGHSLGGSAAASLLLHDRRVRAGVDLDGTLGEPVGAGGFGGRAFLLFGATADHPGATPAAGDGAAKNPAAAAGDGASRGGGAVKADGAAQEDDDPTWAQAWAHLGPPRLWLDVDGADHFSFTDDPVLADQIPLPAAVPPAPAPAGALTGRQALAITRAYVGAFVERWLCGRAQPLLDAPSRAFPQVRVVGRDPQPGPGAGITRRR
ncbi:lipase [Frankia sp. AvcI1]|uniref:alpha/beta hydrolase family protein n=1 Tax=Frankia sp. AvcI1 TaxID=573496 RepID=UPI00211876F1|nr:lipase [Frankia sp. AvcI1]